MSTDLSYFWKKKTLLSFIAVFFVVIIHNSATNLYSIESDSITNFTIALRNFFAYDLGAVAVPLFFFLSGFAFFRNFTIKEYNRKLKSRFKSLFVPYLAWNIFGLLVIMLCTYTPLSNIIASRETFSPSISNFLEGIFLYKYNFQFWFMYDLIIYVILTPVIYYLIYNKFLGLISTLLIFILPFFCESFLHLDLHFTIFYFLGCFAGRHYLKFFATQKSTKFTLASGLIMLIAIIIKFLTIYNILYIPMLISQFLLIIIMLSLWFFSDIFISKLPIKKFTTEFFPIYTLHTYFLAAIIKIIFFILPHTSISMLANEILSSCLTMVVVTAFAYFWHQKLPKSYNLLFSGKD